MYLHALSPVALMVNNCYFHFTNTVSEAQRENRLSHLMEFVCHGTRIWSQAGTRARVFITTVVLLNGGYQVEMLLPCVCPVSLAGFALLVAASGNSNWRSLR